MKKVVVLGGGESGFGSAVLAKQKGFEVIVSDSGKIADKYKTILEQWAIPYEEGGHTDAIKDAELVIKSPGIPDKVAVVDPPTPPSKGSWYLNVDASREVTDFLKKCLS